MGKQVDAGSISANWKPLSYALDRLQLMHSMAAHVRLRMAAEDNDSPDMFWQRVI
jgi:hypothetical protein